MPREHIEFIQSQKLEWRPWPYLDGIDYKPLSRDPSSGATTGVFRFAPGWRCTDQHWLESEEEFFILKGVLIINEMRYTEGYYGYLPKHYLRRLITTEGEAIVVRFIDHNPKLNFAALDEPPPMPREPIEGIDTFAMRWDRMVHDDKLTHLDFGRKILRIDPVTKAKTFLYMVSPQTYPDDWQGPKEYHPTVEEAFCVTGTLAGPHGIMRTGAYFWRPPQIPHGPFGSRTGCVLLIRFVGGEHINHWTEQNFPFNYDAPYAPVLPRAMADHQPDEWRPEPY